MADVTYWLPSLLVVVILKETEADFVPCSEFKRELEYVNTMNHRNELLLSQCQVSRNYSFTLTLIGYSYISKCIKGFYTLHMSLLGYSYM
jgi:hypothetical protein